MGGVVDATETKYNATPMVDRIAPVRSARAPVAVPTVTGKKLFQYKLKNYVSGKHTF